MTARIGLASAAVIGAGAGAAAADPTAWVPALLLASIGVSAALIGWWEDRPLRRYQREQDAWIAGQATTTIVDIAAQDLGWLTLDGWWERPATPTGPVVDVDPADPACQVTRAGMGIACERTGGTCPWSGFTQLCAVTRAATP